jgi:hypothetical protein
MISSNELSNLYKIISDENQSFENISQSIKESFDKSEYQKIAISLCILIKDNLLNFHQRLISFYILYFIQKNDKLEISPFLPLIIETIQNSKNKNEQSFLIDILFNQINYLNISVKTYIQNNPKEVKINIPQLQKLFEKFNDEKNKLGNYKKTNDYIRSILYDRKKSDIKNVDNHLNVDIISSINIEDELAFKLFEPNYMSYSPMNLNMNINSNGNKFLDNEPIWIFPNLKHNYIWKNEKKENCKDGDMK